MSPTIPCTSETVLVWSAVLTSFIGSIPQGATEEEADAQRDHHRRDRVGLDHRPDVVGHARQLLVLDVLAGLLQPAGDALGGAAEHALVRALLADRVGQVLRPAADRAGGVVGPLAYGR